MGSCRGHPGPEQRSGAPGPQPPHPRPSDRPEQEAWFRSGRGRFPEGGATGQKATLVSDSRHEACGGT